MAKTKEVVKQKKLPRMKRLRVLLITVVLLLIPVLIYFTLYVSNETDYFNNQNFRQLASISDQIEQRIEGRKVAFNSGIKNALKKHQGAKPITKDEFQKALGTILDAIDEKTPIPAYTKPEDIDRDLDAAKTGIILMTEGETRWLVFVCKIMRSGPDNNKAAQVFPFRARIRLDDLVSPLMDKREIESLKGSEHEAGFDDMLIASLVESRQNTRQQTPEQGSTSKIIFHDGSPEIDVASLDSLPRADDPDKTIDFKTLSRSTNLIEVKLADSNYKLYLQPLNFGPKVEGNDKDTQTADANNQAASNDQQEETRWVICGLVQSSHFRHETWAFSYTLLILLAFAISLIALSWPFLRLMFMGPKDRLRLADAYFVAFALLVVSAILTLLVLYGFTYRRSEHELDDQLKNLSKDISINFSDEVKKATEEIDKLNQYLNSNNPPGTEEASNKRASAKDSAKRAVKGRVNILNTIKNDLYPYFTRAVWIDDKGQMKLQWTVERSTADNINVANRDYFKNLKAGNFRELNNSRFWLEPLTSKLSGTKVVVISKLTDSNEQKTDNKGEKEAGKIDNSLTTIVPNMLSLVDTVVPEGFGYRIIDSSGNDPGDEDQDNPGKVLFQSSETQQSENFFHECDNNHSLRSLIFAHGSDFVNVNYGGIDHELYVTPMQGFPNWYLIVFRNKQMLRTVYLQTLALTAIIFLFYLLILLVVFSILYLIKINTRGHTEWIWPSEKMSDVYYKTFFVNLILCILGIVVVFLADRGWAILLIGAIAFTGILTLGLGLKIGKSIKLPSRTERVSRSETRFVKRNGYVWNMVLLLVLTGMLPAVAFFKVSYNQEMRLFVKQEQINIANGLQEREARVKKQYAADRADSVNTLWYNPKDAEDFINKRLDKTWDVYDSFFFGTNRLSFDPKSSKEEEPLSPLMTFFTSEVPIFNQTSVEQGGLATSQAADNSWDWLEGADGLLTLHKPAHYGNREVNISTHLQRLSASPLSPISLMLCLLIVLAIIFCLARFVVRRIFLLGVDEGLSIFRVPKEKDTIKQSHFVIQSSLSAEREGFLKADEFYHIDIAAESHAEGWVEIVGSKIKDDAPTSKIVVDHFEYRLNHPGMNRQKLKLVKQLLDANKTVVIMSSSEPAAYSFGKAANGKAAKQDENGSKAQPNGSDAQWAEIISRFRKAYLFERECEKLDKAIDAKYPPDNKAVEYKRSQKNFQRLMQLMKRESAPRAFLEDICVEIVKQDGFEKMEPDCVTGQILDQAELYYQKIWDDCSEGEKLTLLHLAQDRLLSPNDPDIKPLLQRGLLERAPDVHLMNETFKQFVLLQCMSGGLESIEIEARRASPWQALKAPLLIIFIGVLLFLFLTQKSFYNSSLTIVTALTTSIPAFFKLLGLFQSDGASPKA